jgi:uncharacterized protein YjiS (DUF1127 family)
MMERHMLTDGETDFSALNLRDLSPEDWTALRRRAIERAHRTRSQMVKALTVQLVAAVGHSLMEALRAGVGTLALWRSHLIVSREDRAAIARLRALDDRALKDIGIPRTEIESIVHAHGRDTTRTPRADRMAA